MIQANDLRFGNKVYNQAGEVITVQQILQHSIVYNNYLQVDRGEATSYASLLQYTSKVVEVVEEVEYQNLQPIPLTEDLLKNCGFKNFRREEWILSFDRSHADFEFTAAGLRMREPAAFKQPIRFLHQLQNFFHALTGKELEVRTVAYA